MIKITIVNREIKILISKQDKNTLLSKYISCWYNSITGSITSITASKL